VKKLHLNIAVTVIVGLLLIQFLPMDLSNPPIEEDIPTSPDVKTILKRACYDCHSNETVWPWYSRIAPVSWLLLWDVKEGREELNFSTWNRYSTKEQSKKIHESWEEVEEGEMPLWFYLPLHPEAALSDKDRAVLREWAKAQPYAHDEEDD